MHRVHAWRRFQDEIQTTAEFTANYSQIFAGANLLQPIARRLPVWWCLAPVLSLPGIPLLLNRIYLRWATWRFRRTGRQPFA